jgi:site-specific recombinase XerD
MVSPTITKTTEPDMLFEKAKEYAAAALAKNSQRAYKADFQDFCFWCLRKKKKPLPALPETVALYLSNMALELKVSSLRRRMTSINAAHELSKVPSPTKDAHVKKVMRGIIRTHGEAQKHASPTLLKHIQKMTLAMPKTLTGTRNRALLLLGFAGGFRRSELTGINIEDLSEAKEGLVVKLVRSKTDQTGKGRQIAIAYGSDSKLCPVRAVQAWLKDSGITEGPLFRAIDKWGYVSANRLTDQSVRLILIESLKRAGLSTKGFSGHSLRAGFVTVAFINGASERDVQLTTGHTNTNILRRYHRDANLFRNAASGKLGL